MTDTLTNLLLLDETPTTLRLEPGTHPLEQARKLIAFANDLHFDVGERINFEDPIVLVDSDRELTLLVSATSTIYGRRHGIGTAYRDNPTTTEGQRPWQYAETIAVARCFQAMGIETEIELD